MARQLNTVLTAPVDGDGVTYFLKGQVLVTTTVLLIELDAAQLDSGLLASFVELLLQVWIASPRTALWFHGIYAARVFDVVPGTNSSIGHVSSSPWVTLLRCLLSPQVLQHTNSSPDRELRAMAAECLTELEAHHPSLLHQAVGHLFRCSPLFACLVL